MTEAEKYLELLSISKSDCLLKEGSVCNYYYFVEEGILRNFYTKKGIEVTTGFTFPNDVATNFRSSLLKKESDETIQAVVDSKVYRMSIQDFEMIKDKYPELREIRETLTSAYVLLLEERLHSIQFCTAAERYRFLLENNSYILKQIPLTYIASYLGVTLETLSRIRANAR